MSGEHQLIHQPLCIPRLQRLYAQGWYRDPGASKGTNLSAALTYTLCN